MKSEPDVFSLDDLCRAPGQVTGWEGVRNYQARNFMRDDMRVGDRVLYYHSNCDCVGVAGIAEIAREAYPDPSAWDPASHYHDPKSSPANPRWVMVDVRFVEAFARTVTLAELKAHHGLSQMAVVQKGQRLSVQPVTEDEFRIVVEMAGER